MKKALLTLGLVAAAAGLSGCAVVPAAYGPADSYYDYGPRPYYGVRPYYAPPAVIVPGPVIVPRYGHRHGGRGWRHH